jgi:hypothetical protein
MHSNHLIWALVLARSVSGAVIERNVNKGNATVTTTFKPPTTKSMNVDATVTVDSEPCAKASIASASYVEAHPSAALAQIPPSIAYQCLKSVEVDKDRDIALLDYIEPYVNWQSTLEGLADPPEGYLLPGVDVLLGIGQIRAKLAKGEYKKQVDFALDLKNIVRQISSHQVASRLLAIAVYSGRGRPLCLPASYP